MKNIVEIKQKQRKIFWMWKINYNIKCIVLVKYERMGSDEQEIILVWPQIIAQWNGKEVDNFLRHILHILDLPSGRR